MGTTTSTSGNDNITAGSGNDIIDGGAGSDRLNAGSGNDILVYQLSQNSGASDSYQGGSGWDTVRLMLTSAELDSAGVQSELSRYYTHLVQVQRNLQTGEVSNGSARDFTFDFGSGTTLTVSMMEALQVYRDGVAVNIDAPYIDRNDSTFAGAVKEDTSGQTTSTGTLQFVDLDVTDTHAYSTTAPANALGSMALTQLDDSTGDGVGHLQWTYTLNNASPAVQALAAGQVVVEQHQVRIADANNPGNFVVETITITVTGTNDIPVVSAGDVTGAVQELPTPEGSLSDSGTIAFSDVDLLDVHGVGAVTPSAGALGALTASVTTQANDVDGTGGVISWNYSVDAAALEYLAQGQTKIEMFSFTLSDGHGGEVVRTVSVTLTGTNDAPTVSASAASTFVEAVDAGSQVLSQNGTVSFDDVDATDVVNVSSIYNGDIVWTGGTLSDAQKTALTAGTFVATANGAATPGSTPWTYAATAPLDFLAVGESITFSYTVTATDSQGASATDVVSFTITGTNDAPVIGGVATGVAKEDTTLTATGQLTSTDIDNGSTATWTVEGSNTGFYGSIAVDSTGQWTYTLANGSNGVASAVQSLAAGESHNESFTIRVSDGLGGFDDQLVTVTVTGTNDAPLISGVATGAAKEDTTLTATGQLTSTDIDNGAAATWTVEGSTTGTYGSIAVDSTGEWTYTLANGSDGVASAVQSLAAGETHDELFTIRVSDGLGGFDDQVVTVTVTGTNNAPVIAGVATGAAKEDTTLSATGQLTSSDIDNGATATWTIQGSNTGTYGSIAVDSTGKWTYTLANGTDGVASVVQSLAAGETHNELFTIRVSDGLGGFDDQIVTVTVTGTNDAASITGTSTGSVTEDGTLSAGGTLSVSDVDAGQAGFQAPAPSALVGTYGTFTFTVATGVWTYALNNASAAVQALNTGDVRHDTLVLTSTDGSASRTLDVTVNGTNEPVVNRPPTDLTLLNSSIQETSLNKTAIGTFTAVDPDVGSTLTYTLLDNAGGRFAINASTGELTLARTDLIDFENATSHGIQVRVTDAYGASYTEAFTINVTDAPSGSPNSGDNVLDGTNGNDPLSGGSGDDRIFGGNGIDVLQGDNGTDALYGQLGNDTLSGGQNDDIVLDGGAGADMLIGGQGIDVLLGGLGIDTMTGGQGNDLYIWRAEDLGSGKDVINDFSSGGGDGTDKLRIGDLLVDYVQGTSALSDFVQLTAGPGGSVTVSIDQNGAVGGSSFVDLVTITNSTTLADVTAALVTTNYLRDQYIG